MEHAPKTNPTAIRGLDETRSPRKRLLEVIRVLEGIVGDLSYQGMDDEAGSVATVIGDLRWQCEQLPAGKRPV